MCPSKNIAWQSTLNYKAAREKLKKEKKGKIYDSWKKFRHENKNGPSFHAHNHLREA